MNDKDKEAFVKWYSKETASVLWEDLNGDEIVVKAWQAACEYKDISLINGTRMKQMNEEIERLKAENAKLKECVNIYANKYAWHGTHINSDDLWFDETQGYFTGGKHARQVLKELEDK